MVSRSSAPLAALVALATAVATPACVQTTVVPDDGSSIRYEPVVRDTPTEPPARQPAPTPSRVARDVPKRDVVVEGSLAGAKPSVVVERHGDSTVRYEPILDEDPVVEDEAPARDGESDHTIDHTVAAEDRPGAVAPPPAETVPRGDPRGEVDPAIYGVHLTPDGLAFPYPTAHFFRGFGACRGNRHSHEAIDLGGVGPDWGIGTPIRAMARAEVTFIGTGKDDPDDFGTPDDRDGDAMRGDKMLPRSLDIAPYGKVFFFTRLQGRWRSGNIIITRVVDGPLAGHVIRYLHVAAVHPDVRVGSIIERGQEIAAMGGTGVQDSAPHLHLDIQAPDGHRLDVAPLLGLAPTATCKNTPVARAPAPVRDDEVADEDAPARPTKAARPDKTDKTEPEPKHDAPATLRLHDVSLNRCKATTRHEDFTSGRYSAHTTEVHLAKGQRVTLEVVRDKGAWKPRLQVDGDDLVAKVLASGKIGAKAVTTVTAGSDTTVHVVVGGWSAELPSDATYTLDVSEKCRTR